MVRLQVRMKGAKAGGVLSLPSGGYQVVRPMESGDASQLDVTIDLMAPRQLRDRWVHWYATAVSCVERDSIRRLWRLYVLTVLLEERILTATRRHCVWTVCRANTPHRSLLSV